MAGGRWNSVGVPIVYTSGTQALAMLEMLVHLGNAGILPSYSICPAEFDESLITKLDPRYLPNNWRTPVVPPATQSIGDAWAAAGTSAVLEVPSVISPTDSNYLINPGHRDFSSITIGIPEPFTFDERLVKR